MQKLNLQVRFINSLGYKAQSKDAKNVSRTMLRMTEGGELHSGKQFGTYKLVKTIKTHTEDDSPF